MKVEITDWALNSYLELLHKRVFTVQEYKLILRPDAVLLQDGIPSPHAKLQNAKFWGPATDSAGNVIAHGFKLKWHNFGNGQIQLRVCVGLLNGQAYLCQGFVKSSDKTDKRECAKLKVYLRDIAIGRYTSRGFL